MPERNDWTWEEWGNASIGWRLAIVGSGAGRLVGLALKSPFSAVRAVHPWVQPAEPWGILLAVIALSLSLVAFWIDYSDRIDERTVRAWQLLTTPAPGNSGKREALEYLNRRDGLWCRRDDCFLTLKERADLLGIDLSPPDRGEPGNPEDDGPGAFLVSAKLPGANLVQASLFRADLSGADLSHADLSHADLGGATLIGATLGMAQLHGANLGRADLARAHFYRADLSKAFLAGANLGRASHERATLKGAILNGADLSEADLSSANFSDAEFKGANLRGAEFDEAVFSGANLSFARGLTQAQINSVYGDKDTKIPEGLTRPAHWPK